MAEDGSITITGKIGKKPMNKQASVSESVTDSE